MNSHELVVVAQARRGSSLPAPGAGPAGGWLWSRLGDLAASALTTAVCRARCCSTWPPGWPAGEAQRWGLGTVGDVDLPAVLRHVADVVAQVEQDE